MLCLCHCNRTDIVFCEASVRLIAAIISAYWVIAQYTVEFQRLGEEKPYSTPNGTDNSVIPHCNLSSPPSSVSSTRSAFSSSIFQPARAPFGTGRSGVRNAG